MGELIQSGEPAAEPVDLAEIRAGLRSDTTVDDAYLHDLIKAARVFVEARIRQPIIDRAWTYRLDDWPSGDEVVLPEAPIHTVTAVAVESVDGSLAPLPLGAAAFEPTRCVILLDRGLLPALGAEERVRIDLQVGFGAAPADVPGDLRQALRLLVSHWYERREIVEPGGETMPYGVEALLAPYRKVRL